MRCSHCKSKLRTIQNDFKNREVCKTCYTLSSHPIHTLYSCRKNIYQFVNGKYRKVKYCEKISNKFSFWKSF